ncbi:MAG: hypothetical protein JO105_01285 [Hyphomicrobiales bacterium]|nr:hypothetical protein [Hyphomicrobiales bacterium]
MIKSLGAHAHAAAGSRIGAEIVVSLDRGTLGIHEAIQETTTSPTTQLKYCACLQYRL